MGKGVQSRRCLPNANVDAQPSCEQERQEVDAWPPRRGPGVDFVEIFTPPGRRGRSRRADARCISAMTAAIWDDNQLRLTIRRSLSACYH